MVCRLGRCEAVEIGRDVTKPPESATKVFPGVEIYVPIAGLADLDAERGRLQRQADEVRGHIERARGKLANENFVSRAPAAVVERERARLAELEEQRSALGDGLGVFGLEFDDATEVGDGGFGVPLLDVQRCTLGDGLGVVWLEFDDATEVGDGGFGVL